MLEDFLTYFKDSDNEYQTYDNETGQYETMVRLPDDCNRFEILNKKFELSNAGLKEYAEALITANEEIKTSKLLPFKYDIFNNKIRNKKSKTTSIVWRSSAIMALSLFRRLTPKSTYQMLQPLVPDEVKLSDMCVNSGLFYASKDIELKNAYSYDYRMFYPSILANEKFFFPSKPGHHIVFNTIDMTDLNVSYGYYNCKIIIDNTNCLKVFMPNKNNYYTHYDLIIALKLKKQYGGVTIKPLGKAYIYEEDDLINSNEIFGYWYSHLKLLKAKFPKNIIVKMLSSSLWGYLVQSNYFRVPEDEAEKMKLTTTFDKAKGTHYIYDYVITKNPKNNYYKLLDLTRPMLKNNFRIKSFITGFARLEMCKTLFVDLDRVHRIVIDGFIIDGPFKTAKRHKTLLLEPEKCGHVTINNIRDVVFHDS